MDLIEKIISATGLSRDEIERKIVEKQRELSNLISKEGAAYIVAKELGIELVRPKQKLEIRNLVPGIRNLNLEARVVHVFEPREFERDGKHKVVGLILSDGTGRARLSLWDEQVKLAKSLQPGVAVQISGAYTRGDGREIRLGRYGRIELLESSDLPSIEEIRRKGSEAVRSDLKDVHEGDNVEVRAMIAQLFDVEQYFEVCPECGARVKKTDKGWVCEKHGVVEPSLSLVVSAVLDDGTANIRAVFFRENALKLLGLKPEQLLDRRGKLFEGVDLLGKEFIVRGRIRKNKIFGRNELIVSAVQPVDLKAEIGALLNVLG